MNRLRAIGLLAAIVCGAVVMGQDGPPPPQGGGGHGGRMEGRPGGPGRRMGPPPLFMRPDVQKELKLTEEQIEKLRSMMPPPPMGDGARGMGGRGERPGQPPRAQGGGGRGGAPEGDRREDGPMRPREPGREDERLAGILSDGQLKRLKELRLQHGGAQALGRKDVADKVGLSDEDRQRIRGMIEEAMENMPRPEPGQRPDPEEMRQAHEAMRAQLNQRILSSLNSKQRAKWEELCGKPFKFDESWRPPQPPMEGQPPMGGGGFGG